MKCPLCAAGHPPARFVRRVEDGQMIQISETLYQKVLAMAEAVKENTMKPKLKPTITGRLAVESPNVQYLPGTASFVFDKLRETKPDAFARLLGGNFPGPQDVLNGLITYRYTQTCNMPHHEAHAFTQKTPAEILADIDALLTGLPWVPPRELKLHPDDYALLLAAVHKREVPKDEWPSSVMGITIILDVAAPRWHTLPWDFFDWL